MAPDDTRRDKTGEWKDDQPLAQLNDSEIDDDRPEPNPDHNGLITADPRKRLRDGNIDPETGELEPKGNHGGPSREID